MTNFELEEFYSALCKVLQSEQLIPATVGYKIACNKAAAEAAVRPYLEVKDQLIRRYGKNGEVKQGSPGFETCVEELKKVGTQDVEVSLRKIKLSDLENVYLSPGVLYGIMPMIEEE